MTEFQWHSCTDPYVMLTFLQERGPVDERRLRLFASACLRRIWHLLPDERCREAVVVAEGFADGLIGEEEHREALVMARDAYVLSGATADALFQGTWTTLDVLPDGERDACAERYHRAYAESQARGGDRAAAWAAAEAALAAYRALSKDTEELSWSWWNANAAVGYTCRLAETWGGMWDAYVTRGDHAEAVVQARLLRDIVGSPGAARPRSEPTWMTPEVLALAKAMYDSRDFKKAPALARLLQDAGCADDQVLGHLRGEGPHARGCHVVDAVLGRSP